MELDNKEKKQEKIGFIFCKMTIKHKINKIVSINKNNYEILLMDDFYIWLVDNFYQYFYILICIN